MKTYKFRDEFYTVQNCTYKDIPSHLERVLSYYSEEDVKTQKKRMLLAVYNGTAQKLVDSKGKTHVTFYYEFNSMTNVSGILLWWSSFRMFIIFGLWFRPHTMIQYFHIVPHNDDFIPFKCIIEDEQIEDYLKNKDSLLVDLWSPKCERGLRLVERLGIEEVQ